MLRENHQCFLLDHRTDLPIIIISSAPSRKVITRPSSNLQLLLQSSDLRLLYLVPSPAVVLFTCLLALLLFVSLHNNYNKKIREEKKRIELAKMGDDSNADEVKARLRLKIRSQAEELLSKADNMINKVRSDKDLEASEKAAKESAANGTTANGTADGGSDENNGGRASIRTSIKSAQATSEESSDELTKRLQKLALERQKQNKGDRLKVIQSDTNSHLSSAKNFQDLNLPKHLLDAIFSMGFDRPSAIQEEALPRILADPPRNVIGQAQSGSGKTAAFTLGMLYRINVDAPATTQALCVTPTRELAIQIFEKAVKPMAANMPGLKVQLAVAGTHIGKGEKCDAHIIIGTPGKVVDWMKRRLSNAKTIKTFVLDEADSMIEEGGHRANSLLIKKNLHKKCQSLFFSATFPPEVVSFAGKMVENPDKILIEEGDEFLVSGYVEMMYAV